VPTAVVPLLERRGLDLDVREAREPLAGERRHACAELDGGHRVSQRGQRTRRLPGAAPHLQHRRPRLHASDGHEVRKQLIRVRRSHTVVERRHLVKHPTEVTSVRTCHPMILP
jgi:hypothetical protein